jgi:hypothetical protein
MIGYHSVSPIADAVAKGISDYDMEKIFEAMKKNNRSIKSNVQFEGETHHLYTIIVSYDHLLAFYIGTDDAKEFTKASKKHLKDYEKSQNANRLEILAFALKIPLYKIKHLKQNMGWHEVVNKQDYDIFQKFINLLERDYSKTRKVTDYSSAIGITQRKLVIICRLHSGDGCKELIDARLISEAQKKLQVTSDAIKKIALD